MAQTAPENASLRPKNPFNTKFNFACRSLITRQYLRTVARSGVGLKQDHWLVHCERVAHRVDVVVAELDSEWMLQLLISSIIYRVGKEKTACLDVLVEFLLRIIPSAIAVIVGIMLFIHF